VAAVVVERAPAITGPWLAIAPERRDESGVTVALDRTADASGRTSTASWFSSRGGGQTVSAAVAASQRETPLKTDLMLLSANPTSAGARVQYNVARAGRVRLEVLDVSGRVEETLADRFHAPDAIPSAGTCGAAWAIVSRNSFHPSRDAGRDEMTKLAIIR
jgi:hypothetical protein